MLRCFKTAQKKEEEISSPFFDNKSVLLEELITTFNGRQENPIRCFKAEEIITATNNFADVIGYSLSGVMYKGFIDERQVLVKKFRNEESDYLTPKESIRDIAITSQMSQLENVLKFSGCCLEFKLPALVYEYVEYETLHSRLRYNDNNYLLPWRNRIKIAIDIASAVLYLHTSFQTPIIYRNLSPFDVIIDEHGVAKLIDFSLSISLPLGESQVEDAVCGSVGFIDPEYLNSGILTPKSDVYSFGVMLIVLVRGQDYRYIKNSDYEPTNIVDYVKHHFENDQLRQIIDPIIVFQGYNQQQFRAILDLAMRCTHKRSEDRPEMIDVARELRQIEKSVNR